MVKDWIKPKFSHHKQIYKTKKYITNFIQMLNLNLNFYIKI